jgi:hypothetical protein
MEIKSSHKGQTVKTVVLAAGDKDEALTYAMHHAGETQGSLFGWDVTEDPDNAGIWTVKMYTD